MKAIFPPSTFDNLQGGARMHTARSCSRHDVLSSSRMGFTHLADSKRTSRRPPIFSGGDRRRRPDAPLSTSCWRWGHRRRFRRTPGSAAAATRASARGAGCSWQQAAQSPPSPLGARAPRGRGASCKCARAGWARCGSAGTRACVRLQLRELEVGWRCGDRALQLPHPLLWLPPGMVAIERVLGVERSAQLVREGAVRRPSRAGGHVPRHYGGVLAPPLFFSKSRRSDTDRRSAKRRDRATQQRCETQST